MPQYIWEGLFSVLNVLVPGIVLVLFAAYYQNRRKREIQIEGKLAMERVDGYEQLLFVFYEGQDNHEVTLEEEEKAAAILGYFDVPTFHFQCPNAFLDEAHFDAFYEKLEGLQKDYQIYLDEEASRQLDRSVAIYTHFKIMMDAFCDTEHGPEVYCPCSLLHPLIIHSGAAIYPMRHPVIAYAFETPLIMMLCSFMPGN